jgi:hypothetical protein
MLILRKSRPYTLLLPGPVPPEPYWLIRLWHLPSGLVHMLRPAVATCTDGGGALQLRSPDLEHIPTGSYRVDFYLQQDPNNTDPAKADAIYALDRRWLLHQAAPD